jgi:hypothetical protein
MLRLRLAKLQLAPGRLRSIFARMMLRMQGTPDAWWPSRESVRYSQREGLLGTLVLGAFGLAALPVGPIVLVHEVPMMFHRWGHFSSIPFGVAAIAMAFAAFLLWMALSDFLAPSRFIEIDFAARRVLVVGHPVPTSVVPAQGPLRPSYVWMGSFDELGALTVVTGEQCTLLMRRGRTVGSTVRTVDRLVSLPLGIVLYDDVATFGRTREIGERLASAVGTQLAFIGPERTAPLPAGIAIGSRVAVAYPGLRGATGYVTRATMAGATSPNEPRLVVRLTLGYEVTVGAFAVTPVG